MSSFALSRRSLIGAGIGGATLAGLGDLPALGAGFAAAHVLVGRQGTGGAHRQGQSALFEQPSGHDDRRRVAGLDRLLGAACDANRRSQCSRRAADGLPLHLRIRPPGCPVAARQLRAESPQPCGFQPGRGRQRQGRRQDLRRQPRPQLDGDGLRQGADPESWPERAGLEHDVERDWRSRRRDHQGHQARRLYRHGGRRWQRAAPRGLARPARQVAVHGRGQGRLRRQGHGRMARVLE